MMMVAADRARMVGASLEERSRSNDDCDSRSESGGEIEVWKKRRDQGLRERRWLKRRDQENEIRGLTA
ncbi:hypothetical protein FF2_002195 [Malus domestica]